MNFLSLIRVIREILALGTPPDINDETALKNWVGKVIVFLTELAKESATEADDKVIGFLSTLVTNDTAWGIAYLIVKAVLSDEDENKVGALQYDLTETAVKAGIDPATIIAIVTAVVELLKLWRDRRNATNEG